MNLDEIRARDEAIDDGPWHVGSPVCVDDIDLYRLPILVQADGGDGEPSDLQVAAVEYRTSGYHYPHGDAELLAEFIAHAREDIPALLAEIDRLTRERDEARSRAAEFTRKEGGS